ncbi:MAG: hypothetical protein ACTSYB_04390 [Candidatus Helarchaeota archaeon]
MFYLLDMVQETYSQVMAIINYICFGAFVLCCVFFYITAVVGQFDRYYRHMAVGSLIGIVVLLILHFAFLDWLKIPLIVPPLDTPYFLEFMHVLQYIASLMVVILVAVIFIFAVLRQLDYYYKHAFVSAFIYLIIILTIHWYLEENFGILLIFPPNLW